MLRRNPDTIAIAFLLLALSGVVAVERIAERLTRLGGVEARHVQLLGERVESAGDRFAAKMDEAARRLDQKLNEAAAKIEQRVDEKVHQRLPRILR